jgi:cytidylate kinase
VQRDHLDGSRAAAPLRQAPDAIVLDTTAMSFDGQVAEVVALARKAGKTVSESD